MTSATSPSEFWFGGAILAVAWVDDRVGEAQPLRYRVTPLRHRWIGEPSPAPAATTPPPTGPAGC